MKRLNLRRAWRELRVAACDRTPVQGLTHRFYRYPARFSPRFAATAIEHFSRPGDLVLDPYMGGGTSVIEALALGRRAVGSDINSLAVFLTALKSTVLTRAEQAALEHWANSVVPHLSCAAPTPEGHGMDAGRYGRNLTGPGIRPLRKILALATASLQDLPTQNSRRFARGVLLNAGQWALNGKKTPTDAGTFRNRVRATTHSMLQDLSQLAFHDSRSETRPTLIHDSASNLLAHHPFLGRTRVDLVVTSPPYPGIHILYHRWQVDGRKETAAPYWLAACEDGRGNSFYNFADRRNHNDDAYFAQSLSTLTAIRKVMKPGALMVQMLAFARPLHQMRRYLDNMEAAGFRELRLDQHLGYKAHRRIWRDVPGRSWHASTKGGLNSSREVALVHFAD